MWIQYMIKNGDILWFKIAIYQHIRITEEEIFLCEAGKCPYGPLVINKNCLVDSEWTKVKLSIKKYIEHQTERFFKS